MGAAAAAQRLLASAAAAAAPALQMQPSEQACPRAILLSQCPNPPPGRLRAHKLRMMMQPSMPPSILRWPPMLNLLLRF